MALGGYVNQRMWDGIHELTSRYRVGSKAIRYPDVLVPRSNLHRRRFVLLRQSCRSFRRRRLPRKGRTFLQRSQRLAGEQTRMDQIDSSNTNLGQRKAQQNVDWRKWAPAGVWSDHR